MLDFKAKMHQSRFTLGLRSKSRWRIYSAHNPLAVFKGPTSNIYARAAEQRIKQSSN